MLDMSNKMDFQKIRFQSFSPLYDQFFAYQKEEDIAKYIYFSKWDTKLIFYEKEFIGFCKLLMYDEEANEREIQIAILSKYRRHGFATYIIQYLVESVFLDEQCSAVHLLIDRLNLPSIKLALHCGFVENVVLEKEMQKNGDNQTLAFSLKKSYLRKYN